MSSCHRCGSKRIGFVQAHSKDLGYFQVDHLDIEQDGYFPDIPVICSGDDAAIEFCLDCGQIQGDFPISDEVILAAVAECSEEGGDYGFVEGFIEPIDVILWNGEAIKVGRPSDLFKHPRIIEKSTHVGFQRYITTVDSEYGKRYLVGVYKVSTREDLYFHSLARIPMGYLPEYLEIDWEDYIANECEV